MILNLSLTEDQSKDLKNEIQKLIEIYFSSVQADTIKELVENRFDFKINKLEKNIEKLYEEFENAIKTKMSDEYIERIVTKIIEDKIMYNINNSKTFLQHENIEKIINEKITDDEIKIKIEKVIMGIFKNK